MIEDKMHSFKVVKPFVLAAPEGMVQSKRGIVIKAKVRSIPARNGQELCLFETEEGFRGIVPWNAIRYADDDSKPEAI